MDLVGEIGLDGGVLFAVVVEIVLFFFFFSLLK